MGCVCVKAVQGVTTLGANWFFVAICSQVPVSRVLTLCCIRYGIYPVLQLYVCVHVPYLPSAASVGFKLDLSIRWGRESGDGAGYGWCMPWWCCSLQEGCMDCVKVDLSETKSLTPQVGEGQLAYWTQPMATCFIPVLPWPRRAMSSTNFNVSNYHFWIFSLPTSNLFQFGYFLFISDSISLYQTWIFCFPMCHISYYQFWPFLFPITSMNPLGIEPAVVKLWLGTSKQRYSTGGCIRLADVYNCIAFPIVLIAYYRGIVSYRWSMHKN